MPYILSPEQKVVVEALTSKETSSTKYFDINTAMQSICKACTTVLANGQKILIHIPKEEQRQLLAQLFAENGMEDVTIDISNKGSMPEVDIIKLRSNGKKQKDTDAIIKYVLSTKKAAAHRAQIDTYYHAFDQKVMSDTMFRDFVINSIYQKRDGKSIINDNSSFQFEFSATEYYKIKKEINTAIPMYQRQFDLFDHLSLFKTNLWDGLTEPQIAEIKNQLAGFKGETAQLVQDFASVTIALTKASYAEMKMTIAQLEDKFLKHEEACIAYQIKSEADILVKESNFSLFKKKKAQPSNKIYVEAFDELSEMIQSISREWYEALDAPTAEMITYDYIIDFIAKNRTKTSDFKEQTNKNISHSIQRINKINTASEDIIALDKRLSELIQKMNTSYLFDLDLEHNILSFVKQAELCKNIADYIEKCNILVNSSSSYLEWKSFFNASSTIFQVIFEDIKKMPKKGWNDAFEIWYKNKVQDHVLGQKTISTEIMQEYFAISNISCSAEVSATIAQLHPQRIKSVDTLKATNKELHSTLFKKKQLPDISWFNTALMNRSFMQSFFPIHISDAMAYNKEYDLVISFSNNEEDEVTKIHYFSPIESKDIQNISEKKDNFLYLNDYQYNRPLRELSSTDKLKASKKLAKYILSLNHNIKIYQLKNANIISLLPSQDDSQLEFELDKINAKVIDTNGVLYNRLTESILFTERCPFLIIKDELINSELHEHALWQLKLIQLFQEMGYQILSVNTTDQIVDNEELFDALLQKIKGPTIEEKEQNKQTSEDLKTIHEEV